MGLKGIKVTLMPNDEALIVRFNGQYAIGDEVIDARMKLRYSSDSLKSVKRYLYNTEKKRINNMFELFTNQLREDVFLATIEQIKEEK